MPWPISFAVAVTPSCNFNWLKQSSRKPRKLLLRGRYLLSIHCVGQKLAFVNNNRRRCGSETNVNVGNSSYGWIASIVIERRFIKSSDVEGLHQQLVWISPKSIPTTDYYFENNQITFTFFFWSKSIEQFQNSRIHTRWTQNNVCFSSHQTQWLLFL